MPTGLHPAGGRYLGAWHVRRVRGAWEGHAIVSSAAGARFTLRYTGGELALVGDRWPQGGRIRVRLDGHGRTINLHSARPHARQVLFLDARRFGHHRLTIRVLSGTVALEGLAIGSRTRLSQAREAAADGGTRIRTWEGRAATFTASSL